MSVKAWQDYLYPSESRIDAQREFLSELEHHLQPHQHVLDLGAGAGELCRYELKGRVKRLVGIDLDPRVTSNPLLDEGVIGDLCQLPFPDQSFDVAFAIYVLEHIAEPDRFIAEVSRVLKPGGTFLCLTPNRFHYVSLIASLTPHSFHEWINKRRGRDEEDTFPTCYRLNTRRSLTRHFSHVGCRPVSLNLIETQPNYLMFSTPTLLVGAAYERLVNSTKLLTDLRVNIIGAFRKAGVTEAPSVAPAFRRAA